MSGAARWAIVLGLLCCLWSGSVPAQVALPQGDPPIQYRRIFVLENQMGTLIPRNYWPVRVDELEELLAQQRKQTDRLSDSKPRLNRVSYRTSYDADTRSLRSSQTTLDITYAGEQPAALDLGRVNWAITDPNGSADDEAATPRWLTAETGSSIIELTGDSQLDVAWSVAGVELPDQSVRIVLQIPRCARSQMLIDLPQSSSLSIDRGVLRELTSAPPEAGLTAGDTPRRWYRLELGGLSEVQLTVRKLTSAEDLPPLVVRRQSMLYQTSAQVTQWTAQMTLEAVPGSILPPLLLESGRPTAIQINNQAAQWTELAADDSLTLQFDSLVPGPPSQVAVPVELTLSGYVSNGEGHSVTLPWPRFAGRKVITTTPLVQVQIQTAPALSIAALVSPPGWQLRPTVVSENGARTMIVEGAIGDDFQPFEIQLHGEPSAIAADATLRLAVEDRAIRARWDAVLDVGQVREPVQLSFERNWHVDSLLIAASGRVIDLSTNQRNVMIWPEVADLKDGKLRLRATGERPLRTGDASNALSIPATWFARLADCRTQSVAAVTPPQSFRWAAGTVLRGPLLQRSELAPEMADLLGPVGDGSLLFRLQNDTTPMLELERPLPKIDAEVQFEITHDADEIAELLTFSCKSPSAGASQLLLRCGKYHGRPPMSWSLVEGAGAGWSLPRLQTSPEDEEETWLVTLPAEQRGVLQLTARRRYRLAESQAIDLPSTAQVPSDESAASISVNQQLTALVDPALYVSVTSGPVQRVPSIAPEGVQQRFRYQPNAPSSLTVSKQRSGLSPAVLWEETVDVIASARWGDTVIASYLSDGRQPLQIQHSPSLRLTEVTANEERLKADAMEASLGHVLLPASGVPGRVVLRFERTEVSSGFVRRWHPPDLQVAGVVLKRNWRMWPAVDSFAPWAPLRELHPATDRATGLQRASEYADGNQPRWLISAELGWTLAATTSLLVFAFCWWLARRSATAALLFVLLSLTLSVGWPDWFYLIAGFVLVPAIGGALLSVSLRPRGELFLEGSPQGSDLDFSLSRKAASLCLAWIVCIGSGLTGNAQDAEPPLPAAGIGQTPAEEVFSILIPITAEGAMSGTRVYVPERVYGRLFRRSNGDGKQSPTLFRRADYRVRINGSAVRASSAKLEARIELEAADVERPVRLPFPAESIREVDMLSDGLARSVRWLPDDSAISIKLPKTGLTTLRLVLDTPIVVDEYGVQSIDFPIPRIGNSTLTFDADASVDTLSAPTSLGTTKIDLAMGDLTAELGPAETLSLRWRTVSTDLKQNAPPLVRRFLIQAAPDKIISECLMDVSAIIKDRGEEIVLDVGTETLPAILSSSWSLVPDATEPAPAAGRMRLRCSNKNLPPIRLIWETPLTELKPHASEAKFLEYSIPAVQLVGGTNAGPTFIALHKHPRQVVQLENPGLVVSMPIERFLTGWNSNVDVIEQALVAEGELPKLLISMDSPQPWQVEQTQQLLVSSDAPSGPARLILDYQATVTPGAGAAPPMQLVLPATMRIHALTAAGREVTAAPQSQEGVARVVLPEALGTEAYQLRFRGSMELPSNGRFAPPLVRLVGIESMGGSYSIARGTGVAVKERAATPLPASTASLATSERLAKSIVPLWAWQLAAEDFQTPLPRLEGQYEVTTNTTETATDQLTQLSFAAGRWTMETIIHLRPIRGRIDFLTVEIPSRWSEDLTVTSAESWSGQPAADPSKRLIRILPADSTKARREIRIRSRLVGGDLSQVSVPEVRVLGGGPRRLFVSVPREIAGTPVAWEATGTRRGAVPEGLETLLVDEATHENFEVGGAWAVKMITTAQTPAQAAVSALDVQIFAQQDRPAMVICRWDLFPAGRRSVRLRVPPQFEILGQWSAGVAVPLSTDTEGPTGVATLPLSLSRLAQPIVLLGQFHAAAPGSDHQTQLKLPQLLDIPVAETWVTRYESEPVVGGHPQLSLPWRDATEEQRYEALTRSILVSLEQSRDSLANRPSEEVAAWIAPWLSRFRKLHPDAAESEQAASDEAQHQNENQTQTQNPPSADSDSEPSSESEEDAEAALSPTEARLSEYLHSVLGTSDWAAAETDTSPLVPVGWSVAQIHRHPEAATTLPAAFLQSHRLKRDDWVRIAATALLSLVVLLVIWRFWSRLSPWGESPAMWLFLMGLISFVFAPISVAIALCVVALSTRKLRKTTPQHP